MDPHLFALLDPDPDSIDFSTLILRNFSEMLLYLRDHDILDLINLL